MAKPGGIEGHFHWNVAALDRPNKRGKLNKDKQAGTNVYEQLLMVCKTFWESLTESWVDLCFKDASWVRKLSFFFLSLCRELKVKLWSVIPVYIPV